MPLRSSQLVFVGLSSAAITLAVIFGAVYWMDRPTKAAANNRTTLELAKATCLAVTEQKSGKELGNFTPEQVCDCLFSRIYPQIPEELRVELLKQYQLAEADAPTDPSARDQYDKKFGERFTKVMEASAKDLQARFKDSAELFMSKLKQSDFGPECNAITFGETRR